MATRGGRGRGHGHGRDALINPPPPPPVTMEQILEMQAQSMQAMMQRLDNEPARGPPPVQVRDKAWRVYERSSTGVHTCLRPYGGS